MKRFLFTLGVTFAFCVLPVSSPPAEARVIYKYDKNLAKKSKFKIEHPQEYYEMSLWQKSRYNREHGISRNPGYTPIPKITWEHWSLNQTQ